MTLAKGSGCRGSRSCRKGVALNPRRYRGLISRMSSSQVGATLWWASSTMSRGMPRMPGGSSRPATVFWARTRVGASHSRRPCQTTPGCLSALAGYLVDGLEHQLLPVDQEGAPVPHTEGAGHDLGDDDRLAGPGGSGGEEGADSPE